MSLREEVEAEAIDDAIAHDAVRVLEEELARDWLALLRFELGRRRRRKHERRGAYEGVDAMFTFDKRF